MKIESVHYIAQCFEVCWVNGEQSCFPAIFLRDNDPSDLHPHTGERTFDLTQVPIDIRPVEFSFTADELHIDWPVYDNAGTAVPEHIHPAIYNANWLYKHRPGKCRQDPARLPQTLWQGDFLAAIPRHDADTCMRSDLALRSCLEDMKQYGLVVVQGLSGGPDSGVDFAGRIGYIRETNFGRIFSVHSKPQPVNLAYTALALPLHTDLTNQELVPGYQFLHSVQNSVVGGCSLFADGFYLAERFRREQSEAFAILSTQNIPSRFHDDHNDIRRHHTVIQCDNEGRLVEINFNAHIADIPDMDAAAMLRFYPAYQAFMRFVRLPEQRLELSLKPGEMAVFDNRRVLHGRTAFDPQSGERELHGFYIDRVEVDSRLRVLHQLHAR